MMISGHNNIKRLTYRTVEEVKSSVAIGGACGLAEGVNAFRAKLDLQIMNHNGFVEPPAVRARLVRKHEAVMRYLEDVMGDFAADYDYEVDLPPVPEGMSGKIWMCWWQGLESAPEIVKACIDSVRKNASGREVVVITDENIDEYIQMPDLLIELRQKGVLSRTHVSDYLRLDLLARYGGIWLDSTFFCCRSLESSVYDAPLFSIKRPDYLHGSIAGGNFANYSLGCDDAHRFVFAAIRNLFLEYWRRNNYLVDYLLTDYLIVMAQRHSVSISEAFSAIESNNPACDELLKILGEPYDEAQWHELSGSTDLFKLTWKQNFPKEIDGVATTYSALISGKLR